GVRSGTEYPSSRAIIGLDVALGGDGFREDEEPRGGPALVSQPLEEQGVLVVKHGEEALTAHITFGLAVNGVAHLHVVGGNGLGHGARSAPDAEEPPGDFLTGADLGGRPVERLVQIDAQRLLVGAKILWGRA